jgi:DNA repair protein RecN (Recombination protein N)
MKRKINFLKLRSFQSFAELDERLETSFVELKDIISELEDEAEKLK